MRPPRGEELSERLSSVLEVVYLIFNEGYTAARGQDWLRPQLCNEALRMGRVLTAIAPHEPEAHGLLALMEMNASRTAARTDATGEPILMLDQNRALWDQLQIRRGMQALERARELGGAGGFYALQAAIIACHAAARTAGETDWPRIAGFYAELAAVVRSPIIDLNRAVAVGMAEGPETGAGDRGPNRARRRERGDLSRSVLFGCVGLAVCGALYNGAWWLTGQLEDYAELGDYLLRLGLSWLFLTFLSFLAFSGVVTALSTFFWPTICGCSSSRRSPRAGCSTRASCAPSCRRRGWWSSSSCRCWRAWGARAARASASTRPRS